MAGGERYEFGAFTLDVGERRLSRCGHPVALEPKAVDVLLALLRRAGRLVTKRELLQLVWPDSFVEEGILAVHISTLRKALGDGTERRFIETVSRSGYRFIEPVRQAGNHDTPPRLLSVAVLPAEPFPSGILSGRDRTTGLTLADALVERLGRFSQLIVRPTRAVQALPGAAQDPAAAGQALQADVVLATNFVRMAESVRVSARLMRTADRAELWRGEFDEPAAGLLSIADAITASVAAYLGLERSSPRALPRPVRPTFHPEAYELFGRGRFHLLRASMFDVPKALEAFSAAIELAPEYAGAHAGLALTHCARAEMRLTPPQEAYPQAKSSALQALAMDPECADAQVALGAVLFWSEWNWTAAEKTLERAVEINPNHSEAWLLLGRVLEARGSLEEALAMKRRALERDPFSPLVHLQVSLSFFLARRYNESIAWAEKALELDPRHPHAREHLAGCYWKQGDSDRYMEENLRHAQLHGVTAEALQPVRDAYTAAGVAGVRRLILRRASLEPQAFPAMQLAILHGEDGDLDAAFHFLNRALEQRDPGLVHLARGPQWDALRGDARFHDCLRRMGLPALALTPDR